MSAPAFSAPRLDRLRRALGGHVAQGALPGLVALASRRGETHVEALGTLAFGSPEPMRRDTIFRVASLTKPIMAAAAMILVEECELRLDDPVDALLPELAERRVLRRLDAELDDTEPARRPITVRDVLASRMGLGAVMAPPGATPIQRAMAEAGLGPGVLPPELPPDAWMSALGALPLLHHPGEGFVYHTASDVLGVLVARAADQPLGDFLEERIFAVLGMKDTGFAVPEEHLDRLPPLYLRFPGQSALSVLDDPARSRWAHAPAFPSGSGGLVSTADDLLAFFRMLQGGGRVGSERLLSRASVALMTTDHLSAEEKAGARILLGDHGGWGYGLSVTTRRTDLCGSPGRFGWNGGSGCSAYADPAEDLVGILLTQRCMESPRPPEVFADFWTSVYQALD